MAVGSFTKITFEGSKEDLEKIYEYAYEGDEGIFYDRVFKVDSNKLTGKEYEDYLFEVGVGSINQACCRPEWKCKGKKLLLNVYSCFDTPIGLWAKLIADFPNISAKGTVAREYNLNKRGLIEINDGVLKYIKPEDRYKK